MNDVLGFEYYPNIETRLLDKSKSIILSNKDRWDTPFFTDTESYIDMGELQRVSKDLLENGLKNVIVLGTGGSIQTLLALRHLSKRNLYPITSSRAVELKQCLDNTNPEDSIVIPISRGGETLDVNSTIGIFLKKNYKFLGLSSKGTMYHMLKKIGCPILDVPDLSGRFAGSISNVGILPAFLLGINVEDFLSGLKNGYKKYMDFMNNPALEYSSFLYNLYKKEYKVIFSMPYSMNLEGSVGLFVQEISESTGKEEKGFMGAYQSAPLCQHSVLEYLLGGTKGAVIPVLWTIENDFSDIILESSIDYINKQSAQSIINYQADATFQALIGQKVPSAKINIQKSDEHNIGNLVAFIQSSIYYLCLLLNVNWSNNPKVIIGKEICNNALKDKSSSEQRKSTREKLATSVFSQKFFKK
jgi:glucose-6-phosphate isomerase